MLKLELPQELSQLLKLYLAKAHPVCCKGRLMFADAKGRPMTRASQMSAYWAMLLKKMGCRAVFPPHRCASLSFVSA